MEHDIHPLAMPFEFQGSSSESNSEISDSNKDIGILLIHSFASSPSEVRPLARYLMGKGYSGIVPLLPGHGTNINDFYKSYWIDWYTTSRDSLLELSKKFKKIIIIGSGLGAILAVHLAASSEQEVINGLVMITPSQTPGSLIINLLPFIRFIRKEFTYDPEIVAELRYQGHYAYSKRPTISLIELYKAIGFAKQRASQVTLPTMFIYPKTPNDDNEKFRKEKLAWYHLITESPDKRLYEINKSTIGPLIYPRGGKVDDEGNKMYDEINQFILDII